MTTISNYILTVLFLVLGGWLAVGYFRTHKHIEYKERMWSPSRILFAVAAGLAVLTLFVMKSVLDYARAAVTIFAIVMFFYQRNGLGKDGVADLGKMVNWSDVKAYDYGKDNKKFTVYMTAVDEKHRDETYSINLDFELKDEAAIKQLLKEQIGKKYRRMRKVA